VVPLLWDSVALRYEYNTPAKLISLATINFLATPLLFFNSEIVIRHVAALRPPATYP
jgi:hypothetical protein